eukprot:s489_g18.t1
MFFKKDSALSLVPTFVKKAEHWHSLKEQKQAKMDELAFPLRTFLFHSMLEALLLRLKETTQSQDQLGTAMTLQVFLPKEENQDLMIPFLKFDPETKALTPLSDRQAITVTEMIHKIQELQKLCLCQLAVLRFHSTQKLQGPLQGPTVPFLLQIGSRTPEATQLYLLLRSMTQSAVWQLVGGSLRPERMGRSCPGNRACEETSGVLPSVPCILRICNRSNHCYANSVMCALCWVDQLLTPAQVIWLPVMHALTQRMSLQAPAADLWDALQWILMHAQWRFPHHQHDAAEYLCYCRRFLIPDLMRLLLADEEHAQCQVRDCGDAWPILFATPLAQAAQSSSGLTIQRLVHNWQHQAVDGFTAFESAPRAVVLQLNRFCEGTEQGKDDTPVCARRICCGPLHTAAVCSQGCVHIWGIDLCKTNDPGAKAPRRGPQPVPEFGPERRPCPHVSLLFCIGGGSDAEAIGSFHKHDMDMTSEPTAD